jgi:hypothetical protein
MRREFSSGQGDDDGVVASENQIDQDDREKRLKPSDRKQFHSKLLVV